MPAAGTLGRSIVDEPTLKLSVARLVGDSLRLYSTPTSSPCSDVTAVVPNPENGKVRVVSYQRLEDNGRKAIRVHLEPAS